MNILALVSGQDKAPVWYAKIHVEIVGDMSLLKPQPKMYFFWEAKRLEESFGSLGVGNAIQATANDFGDCESKKWQNTAQGWGYYFKLYKNDHSY